MPGVALVAPLTTEYNTSNSAVKAATGPAASVWFAASNAHRIARVTPAGAIVKFSPGHRGDAKLIGIRAGQDGNLWFNESTRSRLGRITRAGATTRSSTNGGRSVQKHASTVLALTPHSYLARAT